MYLKTDKDTDEGGDANILVDMFKHMRKEMRVQKAETARLISQQQEETAQLTKSLRQEQEERKADSASHKKETSRLNRLLLEEEEDLKNLTAKTEELTALIDKERKERREVVADLEKTIGQHEAKLEECEIKLRVAEEKHDSDMRDISVVCPMFFFSPNCPNICPF